MSGTMSLKRFSVSGMSQSSVAELQSFSKESDEYIDHHASREYWPPRYM